MFTHHEESIRRYIDKMQGNGETLAVIIGGSIAHGFATEQSDVDVMVVIPDDLFARRLEQFSLTFLDKEPYRNEGHIDGRYVSVEWMEKVAAYGNDATRYAFDGALIPYSRIDGLEDLISRIGRYPREEKEERQRRFYAQFKAWRWYCRNALKKNNSYLLEHAVLQMIFYGGRLLLVHNEMFFPYYKWFMRVLEMAPDKPDGLMGVVERLLHHKEIEDIELFFTMIDQFAVWDPSGINWTNTFLQDTEWGWLGGNPTVAEI